MGSLSRVRNKIMYVPPLWTVSALTRVLTWLLRNSWNKKTKLILSWALKQFVTPVHTLFFIYGIALTTLSSDRIHYIGNHKIRPKLRKLFVVFTERKKHIQVRALYTTNYSKTFYTILFVFLDIVWRIRYIIEVRSTAPPTTTPLKLFTTCKYTSCINRRI